MYAPLRIGYHRITVLLGGGGGGKIDDDDDGGLVSNRFLTGSLF